MTTLAAPSTNEIQNTIAVGNSFERGTDTTITLTDGSAFPNAAHVARIRNLDNTKWCLIIYTSRAGNVLTMGGGAADYALAKCVTVGDEAYEWPAGSIVELMCAADEIAQLFSAKADKVDTVGGDGTAGRIIRGVNFAILNGTNAATLKCELADRWNGDIIAETDNVAKGATTGDFTLNAGGTTLTIEVTGLSGNCVFAIGVLVYNLSGTDLTVEARAGANDIVVNFYNATTGAGQNITILVDTGQLQVTMLYITDA